MRRKHIVTALVIFAVTGMVNQSQSLAEARQGVLIKNLSGMITNAAHVQEYWQQELLIHKVQTDAYSGMSSNSMRSGVMISPQGSMPGDQSRQTGELKPGSSGSEGRYGANPSDNYMRKESSGPSGASNSPYGGAVYGGVPTTPSADPMIKELSRDPSMR